MKTLITRKLVYGQLLALTFFLAGQSAFAGSEDVQLKGPISSQGTTDIPVQPNQNGQTAQPDSAAPGADGIMNQDMIMVAPTQSSGKAPVPLKDLVGTGLKIEIERSDIHFDNFVGVKISVTNETGRPLVIDGEKAQAVIGGETLNAAPVAAIQQAISPAHKTSQDFKELITLALPAAVTVGAAPTIRDMKEMKKPILQRYGPDEVRRTVEFARFGRRILWTQQKVEGIIFFQTATALSDAKLVLPATTLFDTTDTAMVTAQQPVVIPGVPSNLPTTTTKTQ